MTQPEIDPLEDLFEAARATAHPAPQRLLDTIEAQGIAMQPPPRPTAWWQTWLRGIGGLTGLGGLVTATLAGVWIGVAAPAPLADPVEIFLGVIALEDTATLGESGFGWDIEEG